MARNAQQFRYLIGGQPMIDHQNRPRENDPIESRILVGFSKLRELCADDDLASALTVHAHQGMAASALGMFHDDSPIHLPDGAPVAVIKAGGQETTEIQFSIGPNARPWVALDYRLQGGMFHRLTHGAGDESIQPLAPDSYVRVRLSGELQDDETIVLMEPPIVESRLIPR